MSEYIESEHCPVITIQEEQSGRQEVSRHEADAGEPAAAPGPLPGERQQGYYYCYFYIDSLNISYIIIIGYYYCQVLREQMERKDCESGKLRSAPDFLL